MYFHTAKLLQCNGKLFYLFATEQPIWYFWIVWDFGGTTPIISERAKPVPSHDVNYFSTA